MTINLRFRNNKRAIVIGPEEAQGQEDQVTAVANRLAGNFQRVS